MALVVQKYGGTSVGDIERIRNVARRVVDRYNQGNDVVVVVSAMAGETDGLAAILELFAPGSRVLDLGCGDGALLALLVERRGARGEGVELDEEAIYRCVGRGLSVYHGVIDSGLPDYPDGAFDVVILNKSIQEAKHVSVVLREALRVGRRAIVGFPNFAHWSGRWSLAARGRPPMTPSLPFAWHDTPNRRFFTVLDFTDYCRERGIPILDARYLGRRGRVRLLPNLFAVDAILLLGR